jgi:glycosyltransferase involved in cell wall biosynthesis
VSRGRQDDVYGNPASLCLVTDDLGHLDPDWAVGRYCRGQAHLPPRQAWRVHVLYCGAGLAPEALSDVALRLGEAGIGFSCLTDWEMPPSLDVAATNHPLIHQSDRVRHALGELDRQHPLEVVEFAGCASLGFRTMQARQAGLAFAGVRTIVRLDASSQWLREANQRYVEHPDDLEVDYAERYAFEHADVQTSPSRPILEYVQKMGWEVREEARVMPAPLAEPGFLMGSRDPAPAPVAEDGQLVTVAVPYYNLGAYLPQALASLAAQTYPHLEVLVIDDGSTDGDALQVFAEQQRRYPGFRFLSQANAGIGATRNRGLREARGEYFIPMDADNIALPHMVERFVRALRRNPGLAAMTCYFLAFRQTEDLAQQDYAYAYRPTGGPHVLASMKNVYGDANAIFRTAAFRAVGGYETDRDTSWEDWEAFVKLVNAGHRIDVIPDYLFYYRHLENGFSRATRTYRNHQRVLRQFFAIDQLPRTERAALWTALAGLHRRVEELSGSNQALRIRGQALRYRIVDKLLAPFGRVPLVKEGIKWLLRAS